MRRIFSFLFCGVVVFAHQFFAIKDKNTQDYKVAFWADGHWGMYQVQNIFGISARDVANNVIKSGFDYQNNKIFVEKEPALIAMHYDFGYYTFLTNGKAYPQRRDTLLDKEGGNIVRETRKIYKIGKSIFMWSDGFKKPMGLRLEIIPLQNPLILKEGDKLSLQVLFDGEPIQGLEFEDQVDDIVGMKTDKEGKISIKLRKSQDHLQIIGTSIKVPQLDKFADILQISTTLSFKIP